MHFGGGINVTLQFFFKIFLKNLEKRRSSHHGSAETNLTSIHKDTGLIPAVSCGVGRRCGLDPTLLWLWCRPAAIAPITPLAWEPPHVMVAALKGQKIKYEN